MSKITYTNKVAINENAEIPDINKITDDDINEIKAVVNNNDDDMTTISTNLTNATTYSTDEIRIGTWMGKPLYRKVIARNQSITNGTNISVSSLNIDELVKIGAINQNQSSKFKFFGSYYDSSSEKLNIHFYNNNIQVWSGTGVNYTSTIWIEYTKTTDVAS